MRCWITAIIALVLPVSSALGQPYPEAVIIKPEVQVRSGPSDKFSATSKLRIGDRVSVRKESTENPGWLEITPPTGSFSWIKGKSIEMVDGHNGVVRGSDPVPIRPGSSLSAEPPKVERVKLAPGTLVHVLDKPFQVDGEPWLPIRTASDVRYIPADAVRRDNVVQNTPPPVTTPNNPLLAQADAAYQAKDFERARQFYKEVFEKSTDWSVKAHANNRLQSLSPPTASQWQPGPGSTPATSVSRQPTNASLYNTAPQTLTSPPQWSVKGRLRRTTYEKEGQPMYSLENHRGEHLLYVTAAPGLRLRDFEGREIALFGPLVYRSDAYIRTYHMTATHVALY